MSDRVALRDKNSPCALCGGPHPFDTSLPSPTWNAVIRAAGLPDYLCLTCIVREFVSRGVSFTATLSGDPFHLTPIEIIANSARARDVDLLAQAFVELRVVVADVATEIEQASHGPNARARKLRAALAALWDYPKLAAALGGVGAGRIAEARETEKKNEDDQARVAPSVPCVDRLDLLRSRERE